MAARAAAKMGVDKALVARELAAERAARVEAEPAYPQETGADEAEHHGVGLHFGVGIADALAQIEAADQRRDAAGDVDHGATREIQRGDAAASRSSSNPPTPQTMWAIGQ